jgi:hypothetical protein
MKEYVDANMEGKCNLYLETMFKLRYVILKEFVFNFLGCVYDLTAVLIHRGLSAYSGHYVAHIKDKKVYKQNL